MADSMRRKEYLKRRRSGMCVDCNKTARDGKARCEECGTRQSKYYLVSEAEIAQRKTQRLALNRKRVERMLSLVAVVDRLKKRLEVA